MASDRAFGLVVRELLILERARSPVGQLLASFQPEAYSGRGHAAFTFHPGRCLRFASPDAALEFYREHKALSVFSMEVVELGVFCE